jgi:hypothetical protein
VGTKLQTAFALCSMCSLFSYTLRQIIHVTVFICWYGIYAKYIPYVNKKMKAIISTKYHLYVYQIPKAADATYDTVIGKL